MELILFRAVVFCISLIFLPLLTEAQTTLTAEQKLKDSPSFQHNKAAAGTYQIVYKDKDHALPLNGDILYEIEMMRSEDEVKYLEVNDFVEILILPRSFLASKDFKPLEEFIIRNE